jgi:phosphatidylcholine synthase
VIDATDGWFARRLRVKEVLPGFEGRRLDDLIDFQTHTCLPLLIWRAGLLSEAHQPWLLVPLSPAYGFLPGAGEDRRQHFLGFPSLEHRGLTSMRDPPAGAVDARRHPGVRAAHVRRSGTVSSQGGRFDLVANALGTGWAVSLLVILWQWHNAPRLLAIASLAYPALYMAWSWLITIRHWRRFGVRS